MEKSNAQLEIEAAEILKRWMTPTAEPQKLPSERTPDELAAIVTAKRQQRGVSYDPIPAGDIGHLETDARRAERQQWQASADSAWQELTASFAGATSSTPDPRRALRAELAKAYRLMVDGASNQQVYSATRLTDSQIEYVRERFERDRGKA